jgi:hypothetical protein
LAVTPFQKLGADFSIALFAAAGETSNVLSFVVAGAFSFMLGAMVANALYEYFKENFRTTAAIGTLFVVPQLFVYWAFVTTSPMTTTVLDDYFWRGLISACFGWMGIGILVTASVGYLSESF